MGGSSSKSKVSKTRSSGSGAAAPKKPVDKAAMKKRREQRTHAVRELLETEKRYVEQLRDTVEYYMKPLSREYCKNELPEAIEALRAKIASGADDDEKYAEGDSDATHLSLDQQLEALLARQKSCKAKQTYKLLDAKEFQVIFGQLPSIYNVNKQFFEDLQKRHATYNNDKTCIGDIFLEITPYFKMYQNYMNNHEEAVALLSSSKFRKGKKWLNFIQSVQDAGRKKETGVLNGMEMLVSLLILPIQRLPRYCMLLGVIIKNTEDGHPDLAALRKSEDMVTSTTALLNERMAEFELRQQVRDIDKRFDESTLKATAPELEELISPGTLVKPHRKFIKEGTVDKFDRTGKRGTATFFLFNDILIYAAASGFTSSNLKLHQILPIDGGFFVRRCTFVESGEGGGTRMTRGATAVSSGGSSGEELRLELLDRGFEVWSTQKSLLVACANSEERDDWVKVIDETARDCAALFRSQVRTLESAMSAGIDSTTIIASVVCKGMPIAMSLAEPLLIPDFLSDECMMPDCDTKFSTLTRRHHCRYCGKIICADCGKHSLRHKRIKTQKVKPVCNVCYENWKPKDDFTPTKSDVAEAKATERQHSRGSSLFGARKKLK